MASHFTPKNLAIIPAHEGSKGLPLRLIARLDVKGPHLVKGVHLEGLRVLGRPEDFAESYYHHGIDELFYVDVVASLYGRNSLCEMIEAIAKKIFIPLTVGGGIRTLDDIQRVLRAGADKICMNTAAIQHPDFIKQAIKKFGSSAIVVAIEAVRQPDGRYFASIDNGRNLTGVEVVSWAAELNKIGVGEIVVTAVDREGTGLGFDLELVKNVLDVVNVPVVVHGGAGSSEDVLALFTRTAVSGVALSSLFHYWYVDYLSDLLPATNHAEGNFTFLKKKATHSKINACNIMELKKILLNRGVYCRI